MKKRLLLYTTLLLAVFSAISCKKDEETTTIKPSIYGVAFDLATFGPDDVDIDWTGNRVTVTIPHATLLSLQTVNPDVKQYIQL